MNFKTGLFGAALLAGATFAFAAPAAAAPLGLAGSALTHKAFTTDSSPSAGMIVQVQRRGVGAGRAVGAGRVGAGRMGAVGGRGFGGRGYGYRGGGGRGVGPAVGLGIAAGVLGAIGAAAAASDPGPGYAAPVYGGGCYITREPVYDSWGNFRGNRRVRVCE